MSKKEKLYFVVCKDGKHHYANDNGQPQVGDLMPLLLVELDKHYPECSPHRVVEKKERE